MVAGVGASAVGTVPAYAAAEPGQAINNDYGQSDYERSVEIKAQVAGNSAVKTANAKYTSARGTYLYWVKVTTAKYKAWRAAVATGSPTKIAATKKAYVAAKAKRDAALKSSTAALKAYKAAVAKYTAVYTSMHYRPVDGTYTGDLAQYFIGGIGLEPIQVQITVYGGHVSDVAVVQKSTSPGSQYYIDLALPTLMTETMNAGDTPKIAAVTHATLTSQAFMKSLSSALTKAGYKF